MISYEDFKKVEIRAGKILSAEKIPDTDKLLKLSVDFGEYEEVKKVPESTPEAEGEKIMIKKIPKPRQIVSGISAYFPDPAALVGKTCMFVTNLEPRTIRGYESNGMLFAVSTDTGAFSILEPNSSIPPGTLAK
jgi:tRNA-binding EMAP/Myf-like protein